MSPHLEDSIFGDDEVYDHETHDHEIHDHETHDRHTRDAGPAGTGQPGPAAEDATHPTAPRTRAEARRQSEVPRSPQRHRPDHDGSKASKVLVPLVAVALLLGLGFGAYQLITPLVSKAMNADLVEDYPGPGSGEASITVNPGDSGATIARSLADAGVIASTSAFVKASTADPDAAAAIQPGEYTLLLEMKASDALAALNDPANRYLGETVTIREGLWSSEVFAALSEATGIPVADYEAAAQDAEAIGLPAEAEGNIEGWLFPATYTLRTDESPAAHLKILVDKMTSELADAGVAEGERQRTLIVASIVEAEARANVDLGKVARVIENRLDDPNGPTVGFLQMDSTVNFALQKRGNLTRPEYESAKSNPFDTYAFKGLPPGPIGNPGRASIDAAAGPPEGPWFFFVTVNLDTGETLFAETFAEHQRNDAQRVRWCDENPGKCTGGG